MISKALGFDVKVQKVFGSQCEIAKGRLGNRQHTSAWKWNKNFNIFWCTHTRWKRIWKCKMLKFYSTFLWHTIRLKQTNNFTSWSIKCHFIQIYGFWQMVHTKLARNHATFSRKLDIKFEFQNKLKSLLR